MKKILALIMSVILLMLTLCACAATEKDNSAIQNVDLAAVQPLVEAGIITGAGNIKIKKGTEVDFKEFVFVDNDVIKSVSIDDSAVDYNTDGQYTVVCNFTVDNRVLDEKNVTVDWDTTQDMSEIKINLTVTIVTVNENSLPDDSVVTEKTIDKVIKENKEAASGRVRSAKEIEAVVSGTTTENETATDITTAVQQTTEATQAAEQHTTAENQTEATTAKQSDNASRNTSAATKQSTTAKTTAATKSTTAGQTAAATTKPTTAKPNYNVNSSNSEVRAVYSLVNQERSNNGLGKLAYRNDLQSAANTRAKEIVSSFSHTRPNGSACFTAIKETGVSYSAAGENIGKTNGTNSDMMNWWMNSSDHRSNILSEKYTGIAIGCYEQDGYKYYVQIFVS